MLIREIRLQNLLSFGPDTPPLELRPLNVLIGANGSGKSNLIEAIGLLQAAPHDITEPIRRGGGLTEWIWKGSPGVEATLGATVIDPMIDATPIIHDITFTKTSNNRLAISEYIGTGDNVGASAEVYSSDLGSARYFDNGTWKEFGLPDAEVDQSILGIRDVPFRSTRRTILSKNYLGIQVFRDWFLGRESVLRAPQRADERNVFLNEDLRNFGLVINKLRGNSTVKDQLLKYLAILNPDVRDIGVDVEGGTVQVFLQERTYNIPAVRLSDGTLRFLCLLAILCHPNPPPLICIEEPELGLHPDMMSTLADLLREASTRTQLIVTTHSDVLVDAFSETPEDVVVCEKHAGCTTMKRLVKADLEGWLEKYSLGNLWTSGQIGGNRW